MGADVELGPSSPSLDVSPVKVAEEGLSVEDRVGLDDGAGALVLGASEDELCAGGWLGLDALAEDWVSVTWEDDGVLDGDEEAMVVGVVEVTVGNSEVELAGAEVEPGTELREEDEEDAE